MRKTEFTSVALGNRAKPPGLEVRDQETAPAVTEVRSAIEALNKAWAEYRATNDERLKAIESRKGADPLDTEKLSKMDGVLSDLQKRVDEFELRAKRAGAPAESEVPGADPEYRKQFHQFLRRGDVGQLLEKRAMSASDNTEGGYLTNPELDREVAKLARDVSPARQLFTVRSIGAASFKKPMSKANSNTGWVGEKESRPQTNAADLLELNIPTHEIYANVGATQTILDDSFINLEQFIAEEAVEAFDDGESAAFFTGNGVSKPMGLLSIGTTVESGSTRAAQGKLGIIHTGSASGFGTDADKLIDLVSRLRPRYRQNARWLFNTLTEGVLRKIKNSVTGEYVWQPSTQLGVPATLLGYPVTPCDHMSDIADGAIPVVFGDFRRAYLIVDRVGMRTLRDPFTAKPFVLFYMTKRVGGAPQITEAYKGLKTAA